MALFNPQFHDYCRSYYYNILDKLIGEQIDNLNTDNRIYFDVSLSRNISPNSVYNYVKVRQTSYSVLKCCTFSDVHYDNDKSKSAFKKLQKELYEREEPIFLIDETGTNQLYDTEIFITKNYIPNKRLSHDLNCVPGVHDDYFKVENDFNDDDEREMTPEEIQMLHNLREEAIKHGCFNFDNDEIPELISDSETSSETSYTYEETNKQTTYPKNNTSMFLPSVKHFTNLYDSDDCDYQFDKSENGDIVLNIDDIIELRKRILHESEDDGNDGDNEDNIIIKSNTSIDDYVADEKVSHVDIQEDIKVEDIDINA